MLLQRDESFRRNIHSESLFQCSAVSGLHQTRGEKPDVGAASGLFAFAVHYDLPLRRANNAKHFPFGLHALARNTLA